MLVNQFSDLVKNNNFDVKKYTIKGKSLIIDTDQGKFALKNDNNVRLFNYLESKKFHNYPKIIDYTRESSIYEYINDISYDNFIFSRRINRKKCVPMQLSIYKNNQYILHTAHEACKPNQNCTSMLKYTKSIKGIYNYDIIQIIKHSTDANNLQFTNDSLPKYEIFAGNEYMFITDEDNKYLSEFLKLLNIDLNQCAEPDYIN